MKLIFNGDTIKGDVISWKSSNGVKSAPPDVERLYSLTPKELVALYCCPWMGAESDFPEFHKYGFTVTGIYEGWHWYKKGDIKNLGSDKCEYDTIDNVTFEEAYKMVALTHAYWQPMLNKKNREYEEYERLDMIRRLFMRHPEEREKYFKECPFEKDVYYKRFPEEKELYETK